MSNYILVLDADLQLNYWAARNHNSDLNVLRQHPFYDPRSIHPVPKLAGDSVAANVQAIAVTGGSAPATIIQRGPGVATMEEIASAMNTHFARLVAPPIGKRKGTKKPSKKAPPKKKAGAKKAAKGARKKAKKP